jgi:DNA-directed RNA polymerase subunit A'
MSFTGPITVEEAAPYRIKEVIFGLLSPSDIRRIGEIEITEPSVYDEGGLPIQGGVLDPRLGSINPRQRCPVCGNIAQRCPGHFGRLELAKPVIHIGYVRHIHQILNMTCSSCGKILVPEEKRQALIQEAREYWERNDAEKIDDELYRKVRKAVKSYLSKHDTCPHCGAPVQKVALTEVYKFMIKEPEPRKLWPTEIREWLEKIPDEDVMVLGFNPERARPEWAVMTVMLIPPITIRPSIYLEAGERSEDDLTHILVELVKANQKLKESIAGGSPNSVVEGEWEFLQYWTSVFFYNAKAQLPTATQRGTRRPLKSVFQRLSGKEGRFRKNLIGKRVNFSSRTVISPDPMIDIDEVGVPIEVAMTLTVPEFVTEQNIERMKELVMRGPDQYPGANYVRKGGQHISLRAISRKGREYLKQMAESLEPGDIVERHLMDGDYVIFNRQPSLHKLSILGHRVKVLPGSTFRLNPAVCVPYNADFDGDEMNLHALQLLEARVEAKELMSVTKNMISPRTGGAIVGARQDMITSLYYITKKDSLFTKDEAARMLARAGVDLLPEPAIIHPVELWTGKQIISQLLPKDLNYTNVAKMASSKSECRDPSCPEDSFVLILNGNHLSGVLDDNSMGTLVKGGLTLTDVIIRDYGSDVAADFLSRILKMAAKEVTLLGISSSMKEMLLPPEAKKEMEDKFEKAFSLVTKRIKEFEKSGARKKAVHRTKEELLGTLLEEQMLEFEIVQILDGIRSQVSPIIKKYIDPRSNVIIMARTGARGSMTNLAQVVGTVGQQMVKSRLGFVLTSGRPRKGFRGRVLTYFTRGDLSAEARGYVKSSYYDGLNPAEFVFHAMSSRESLIDKGRRTEDSGYFYRRVANSLKDMYVSYDGTVRDWSGRIIQMAFGGDGYDPVKLFKGEPVNIDALISRFSGSRGAKISEKDAQKLVSSANLPSWVAERIAGKVPVSAAKDVIKEVREAFDRAKIDPLTPIGIISAQSIAEPTTQMVLRTFHAPGVLEMDVTYGVERFKELVFYASTSRPSMTIYLKPEYSKDEEKVRKIASKIKEVRIRDLLSEFSVDNMSFSLTMKVDKDALRANDMTQEDLESAISKIIKAKKGDITVKGDSITVSLIEAASKERPYQALRTWAIRILERRIKGIRGIRKIRIEKEGDEFVIKTTGSNLEAVLKIPQVDISRTTTNDCKEVAKVLGIEAARACLFRELMKVLEEQGLEVDHRYVRLIADAMTYQGSLEAIRLQALGIPSGFFSEMKTPLSKMAFEWTYHVALNAARRGDRNPVESPLDALIMGQLPTTGTGKVALRWKLEKLMPRGVADGG